MCIGNDIFLNCTRYNSAGQLTYLIPCFDSMLANSNNNNNVARSLPSYATKWN